MHSCGQLAYRRKTQKYQIRKRSAFRSFLLLDLLIGIGGWEEGVGESRGWVGKE